MFYDGQVDSCFTCLFSPSGFRYMKSLAFAFTKIRHNSYLGSCVRAFTQSDNVL